MASTMACSRLAAWTVAGVVLQILGLFLFMFAFFPVRPALSGLSDPASFLMPTCGAPLFPEEKNLPPAELRALYKEMSQSPPLFDRLVLMILDGLPAEFILGKGERAAPEAMVKAMPYTHSLLSSGKALGYHALAATPTVTMPRLKAIVSGIVGGYMDVAFNFNTQEMLDDNLIDQFYRCGYKMVMLGDETWIKLFPGRFIRQDGVSSFYVKDTVEVDFNVSRHLESELAAKDWNLLILHYLGLDHIGHIGGRNSILMAPKVKEMDDVIRAVHTHAIAEQSVDERTLLVVVSDHGMTDNGNHGGSSYEETDSVALFVGLPPESPEARQKTYRTINQVDIAPTLAILFGLPIPKNSVGILIREVVDCLPDERRLRALEINAFQLMRLLQSYIPHLLCDDLCIGLNNTHHLGIGPSTGSMKNLCLLFSNTISLHKSWKLLNVTNSGSKNIDISTHTVTAYYKFLVAASDWLSRTATNKPLTMMSAGILILVFSCTIILGLLLNLLKQHDRLGIDKVFVPLAVLIHVFSLGSSSFVEEEQYTWHFMACTLYLIFLFMEMQSFIWRSPRRGHAQNICTIIFILICMRVLRGWHQGGVNWVHLPDISKSLETLGRRVMKTLHFGSLAFLGTLSFMAIHYSKSRPVYHGVLIISHLISFLFVYLHFLGHQDPGSLVFLYGSQVFTLGFSLTSPYWRISSESNKRGVEYLINTNLYIIGVIFTSSWCLLQLFLQQPVNAAPMLLIFLQLFASVVCFSNKESNHAPFVEVAALYFIGMAGHYGLGNSNTLATIDVAGAFNGISGQSTVLAGITMLIITYASPLLYLFSLLLYISLKTRKHLLKSKPASLTIFLRKMLALPCLVALSFNSLSLTGFTIILFAMRNHLFIWSVFSPKYLYVCGATVCTYIGLGIVSATVYYVCVVVFYKGSRWTSSYK